MKHVCYGLSSEAVGRGLMNERSDDVGCYGLSSEAVGRGLMNERSDDVGFGSREARARGEHG